MDHINDNSLPLIFLGSNCVLEMYVQLCDSLGIKIHGIIDKDYFGNTDQIEGIKVIDSQDSFNNKDLLNYYKQNYNFFCAVNWTPVLNDVAVRDKEKRHHLIDLIDHHQLNCISLVDKNAVLPMSTKIGRGCFIDKYIDILPRVSIGDFTNLYTLSHIGHDTTIGRNCVIQRYCAVPSYAQLENNVFFSSAVKALKNSVTFGENTFIHEGIYIKRGTVKNETVSMYGKNLQRLVSQYVE
jgi:acetyltransferase-like isoleucine patch superfamily enzyme